MKHLSICFVLCLILGAISGCGKDETVTVGNPGEAGLIKETIDEAKDVGAKASEYKKSGEQDVYGG